jgi:O-antigen ligase
VVWLILSARWRGIVDVPCFWLLLLMGMWGLAQTLPYLSRYGIEALRDAVTWGYSIFALVVFAYLLAQPARLATLIRRYRRFAHIFLVVVPFVWFIYRYFFPSLVPCWPWADVPVILPKGGDIQVHLAGILAFWVVGLDGVVSLGRVLLMAFLLVSVGSYDRAGLLSFTVVFALCFLVKPYDRSLWRLIVAGVCALLLLAVSGVRIKMPNRQREISFEQVAANFASVSGTSRTGDLDDTKEWRLNWWRDIIGYTLNGKYCWTGKGFGVNLADEDDYQVEEDLSLRNPHNGHMTMLARAGVPGLLLWALVHLSWGWGMARGYFASRRAGDQQWEALFLFLLAYGLAFMINTSFDVFIEGPMGGIWYWTVYGVGLAALWLYRHEPTALDCLRLSDGDVVGDPQQSC